MHIFFSLSVVDFPLGVYDKIEELSQNILSHGLKSGGFNHFVGCSCFLRVCCMFSVNISFGSNFNACLYLVRMNVFGSDWLFSR